MSVSLDPKIDCDCVGTGCSPTIALMNGPTLIADRVSMTNSVGGSMLTRLEHDVDALPNVVDLMRIHPMDLEFPWLNDLMALPSTKRETTNRHDPSYDVDTDLRTWACLAVGIDPDFAKDCLVVNTASDALLVAIAASRNGNKVLAGNPSIDIYPGLASLLGMSMRYVDADPRSLTVSTEEIVEMIHGGNTACVLLGSPHNPTGQVLTAKELVSIGRAAAHQDVTLIVDQCAAWVRRSGPELPMAPNVLAGIDRLKFACIWDTGKPFGLLEEREKLAFLYATPAFRGSVERLLEVRQDRLDVARRLFFRDVLNASLKERHIETLSSIAATNERALEAGLSNTSIATINHDRYSGPAILLDLSSTPGAPTGLQFHSRLLSDSRVAVMPGECFIHVKHDSDNISVDHRFVRAALLRPEQDIARLIAATRDLCDRAEHAPNARRFWK